MNHIDLDTANGADLNTLQQILGRSKRVVCVTGAGISCSAGIPDFRSQQIAVGRGKKKDESQGLYFQQFGNLKGRELFDASILKREDTTLTFMNFMTALKQQCEASKPTRVHEFVAKLDMAGKLLSCYTQNIDSLEHKTEVNAKKIVQLHGHLDTLNCIQCSEKLDWNDKVKQEVKEEEDVEDNDSTDEVYDDSARRHMIACPTCEARAFARELNGRRRTAVGWMRPNVVLYGEPHPEAEEIGSRINKDLKKRPDCLVVIGTSLAVTGIKTLVKDFAQEVKGNGGHVIFINKTAPAKISGFSENVDYFIQGDCDSYMRDLAVRWPSFWSKSKQSTVDFKVQKSIKMASTTKSAVRATKTAVRATKSSAGKVCKPARKVMQPVSPSRLNRRS
ncbi:NAD-dependent histone deacetylase HST3 [Yarrowia sp. C11]|nr:NAD-dependent histone deacetylase HST3 [Yarrowia sp. E02]KAG5369093.1 NAD-dependent histone deacetylase HST3 [Yarrowia sp. C11]